MSIRCTPPPAFLLFIGMAAGGCAMRGRAPTPASQKNKSTVEEPPAEAALPSHLKQPQTPAEQRSALEAWTRNLSWHGKKLAEMGTRDSAPSAAEKRYEKSETEGDADGQTDDPTPRATAAEPPRPTPRRHAQKKAQPSRCKRACRHTRAICRAADKICRLAEVLHEAAAHQRCAWARNQCLAARNQVQEKCGGCRQ
jgi:hypothetical protein